MSITAEREVEGGGVPRRPRFVADESARSYDVGIVFFHWLIVAMLIVQYLTMPLMWAHVWARGSAAHWHISLGPTILLVMVLRLCWRLVRPAPPPPADLPLELQVASRSNHWALYVLVIGQCCGGWFTASLAGVQPLLFGVVALPRLVPKDAHWLHVFGYVHGVGALVLLGAILLHIAGALYHGVGLRDGVIQRMLPFGRRSDLTAAPGPRPSP